MDFLRERIIRDLSMIEELRSRANMYERMAVRARSEADEIARRLELARRTSK